MPSRFIIIGGKLLVIFVGNTNKQTEVYTLDLLDLSRCSTVIESAAAVRVVDRIRNKVGDIKSEGSTGKSTQIFFRPQWKFTLCKFLRSWSGLKMCLHKDDSYLSVQATHAQTRNFLRCVVQLVYGRQNIFTENKLHDIYRKQASTINIKKKKSVFGVTSGCWGKSWEVAQRGQVDLARWKHRVDKESTRCR